MARFRLTSLLFVFTAFACTLLIFSASHPLGADEFEIGDSGYAAPLLSCVDDLGGVGSLDSTCKIVSDVNLTGDLDIPGKGNLDVLSGVSLRCPVAGCTIRVNISGNFSLGENSTVVAGTFLLYSDNASFGPGSAVNTTALAGEPPPGTSGSPEGIDGAGGGHGGRGACCLTDSTKLPEDVWGGEVYAWSSLQKPSSYGSHGGSTSNKADYGGRGGGRVNMEISRVLELDGAVLADGGNGGVKGGGGSGGSIYIKAHKMTGIGEISASGGDGYAGGGGGRVSIDVFSRHDRPKISAHGGSSFGCPDNAGAAGTLYDAVLRSLTISNNNMTTATDTLLMEFSYPPLLSDLYIQDCAKASAPAQWSRIQVQGQISLLCGGFLRFGLPHYASSEYELLAEELLMSDSVVKVYGALRMTVKMCLMWKSELFIDGVGVAILGASTLEASVFLVLKESSVIHSNGNLGVHGQGLLNLTGPGDSIQAQRLFLSLFYRINVGPASCHTGDNVPFYCGEVGPGAVLQGPLDNASADAVLYCERQDCPIELLDPPEDCNANSSLPFTLQICRVEDITVGGLIKGSVLHFHRARTIQVHTSGEISSTGMGCKGGLGKGRFLPNGIGSGGGHGGKGGLGCYNHNCIEGGSIYGDTHLPCELGSGSGNEGSSYSATGGGIIVIGSLKHPLSTFSLEGLMSADGESVKEVEKAVRTPILRPGGGSGGTLLLFLRRLALGESAILSSSGAYGSQYGGGGGGGGRIHFHWSDIPTGNVYKPIARVKGGIHARGGLGRDEGGAGENGTVTGTACPRGLYGIFCEECPVGTYKNVTGSDKALCRPCPAKELPHRAVYVGVQGGVGETPCPYQCISDRYHMPHCYTTLEELIYTFGGPWTFSLILLGLLILLAFMLSVARIKFVGSDEMPGIGPTNHGSQIDHSFPFLESLNEVMETNRAEESRTHMHRIYFLGPNTFSEPWHLSNTPPDQIKEIVYEAAFNTFVDEINAIAAYQWWEGALFRILSVIAYPLALSWQQWRRRLKFQALCDFVRSEYDHSCLRSCRSRALYEGLEVAASSDLMLAYLDIFLGGDEKTDLPPSMHQRLPMPIIFGGDGSYTYPFSLPNDSILTILIGQFVPPTTWNRLVAGLNAQLRLVRRGRLKVTFPPVLRWLETHGNPALRVHGVHVSLAWFQNVAVGYCQYGLVLHAVEENNALASADNVDRVTLIEQHPWSIFGANLSGRAREDMFLSQVNINDGGCTGRNCGVIIDKSSLRKLRDKWSIFNLLSFLVHNTKPVGHQDLVGIVLSVLLLADLVLVLLALLQLYSISLLDVSLALLILPLGLVLPFPSGINALLSHGMRRSAELARVYALWNITSLINVLVVFICGYIHYLNQSSSTEKIPYLKPWNINMDESEWWIFPTALLLCKLLQSQLINWHVANLEIQDYSLYSNNFELFWQS